MTARKSAPRTGAAATRAARGHAAPESTAAAASRIPANAPQPQDRRKAKTAAQKKAEAAVRAAEAGDGYIDVETCGGTVKLRVPVGGKVPLTAYMAFEKGDELGGTELLLGPEQWKRFMAANPTIDDFAEIGSQLEALAGN